MARKKEKTAENDKECVNWLFGQCGLTMDKVNHCSIVMECDLSAAYCVKNTT